MTILSSLLVFLAAAQIPDRDARLTAPQGTNYAYVMPSYATRAEWEARKQHLRKQILAAAGLLPLPARGPVKAEVFGKIAYTGYTIEKVLVETMPGYFLGGNLYRPLGKSGKFPGVVSPHGHWKKGRLENTDLGSIPGRCINLARQGYVVFAYDMVGYNDTKQTPHAFGGAREDLWNFNPLGLQLWNSIRALDFVESLPDVDKERLAATGASGGGTQTFLLAAVDERIRVDVPVNMVSGIMQGGSPCENAPGLRHDAFNVEFGAMMAPRPMLLVAATGDWTKNDPRLEYQAIRAIYQLYDAASQVEQKQFDSPHNYHQGSREAMYGFFARRILGKDGEVKEEPFTEDADDQMLALSGRTLPPGALDYEGVFAAWRKLTTVREADREVLRYALSVENPASVVAVETADAIAFTRPGRGDRIGGIYRRGTGAPLLVVHPDGAEAARAAVAFSGRPTLWLTAWQGGRDVSARHYYTFHRTDSQNRVQDILTAVRWLQMQHPGAVEIRGVGQASVAALFAAAVAEGQVRLGSTVENFAGTDEQFQKDFHVPGIQRTGGLAAARKLTAGGN
ncbi:MAG: acetylxylan esterase [Candidatus Solibacter usitatus]|nr:acetylxylan esterase [Candidatus Solibacter usitatus]